MNIIIQDRLELYTKFLEFMSGKILFVVRDMKSLQRPRNSYQDKKSFEKQRIYRKMVDEEPQFHYVM